MERVNRRSLYIEDGLWERAAREGAHPHVRLNTSAYICKILREHFEAEDRRKQRAQARRSA